MSATKDRQRVGTRPRRWSQTLDL